MVLRTDIGRVYGEHPGEQKETEIGLSCGMEDGILRWAWVSACEPDSGVAAVGSNALAENCDQQNKLPGTVRGAPPPPLPLIDHSADEHPRSSLGAVQIPRSTQGSLAVQLGPVSP